MFDALMRRDGSNSDKDHCIIRNAKYLPCHRIYHLTPTIIARKGVEKLNFYPLLTAFLAFIVVACYDHLKENSVTQVAVISSTKVDPTSLAKSTLTFLLAITSV